MKKALIILYFFCCYGVCAQEIQADTIWIRNTPVRITKIKFGNQEGPVFINLHENEYTSVEAGNEYLQNKNGLFIGLQQQLNRFIMFELNGRMIQFDPNRIFTKKGRLSTLRLLNRYYSTSAEKSIGNFSEAIVSNLKKAKIIIALHNNSDGQPLSVKSFKQRYVNPEMDADDFILTTEQKIFNRLKQKKINAVLQTQKTSVDDGSLAIYCSKKKIPYINIEAEEGHKEEQLRMLHALTDIIDQYTR